MVEVSQDDRENLRWLCHTEGLNEEGQPDGDLLADALWTAGWRPGGAPVTENTDLIARLRENAGYDPSFRSENESLLAEAADALEGKPPTTPTREALEATIRGHIPIRDGNIWAVADAVLALFEPREIAQAEGIEAASRALTGEFTPLINRTPDWRAARAEMDRAAAVLRRKAAEA